MKEEKNGNNTKYHDKDNLFTKGNPGRPKGTLNKSTELKNKLVQLVNTMVDDGTLIDKVEVKDILKATASLLPKEQTVHHNTEPIRINITTNKALPAPIEPSQVIDVASKPLLDSVIDNEEDE